MKKLLPTHIMLIALLFSFSTFAEFQASGELEIHYVNVGQGGSTLIIGPNGLRILYDFGWKNGGDTIVPYLKSIGIQPEDGLDYTIVSHNDRDHYTGFKGVIDAGYKVKIANYSSGSSKNTRSMSRFWLLPAKQNSGHAVRSIPVGHRFSLGDDAEAIVIAANGKIFQNEPVPVRDENDRSVVLFIRYGKFQFIIDGDAGAGAKRNDCARRNTSQRNLQVPVAQALLALDWMSDINGVDVMHVAHHGAESSTSAEYFNLMKPEVALISVGLNQPNNYRHPRKNIINNVLNAESGSPCVTAHAVDFIFQTEKGVEGDCEHCGTNSGKNQHSIGDIKLVTDGKSGYRIRGHKRSANGKVILPSDKEWRCPFDEDRTSTSSLSCQVVNVLNPSLTDEQSE